MKIFSKLFSRAAIQQIKIASEKARGEGLAEGVSGKIEMIREAVKNDLENILKHEGDLRPVVEKRLKELLYGK